jgi:hypothetical protein
MSQNGLSICKVLGFGRSGLMTNTKVRKLIAEAAEAHVSNKHLTEIIYVDRIEIEPGDKRHRPDQKLGDTEIDELAQTARIRIFKQKLTGNDDLPDFKDSIFHEIGHVVYYFFLTEKQKMKWHQLHAKAPYIWTRAGSEPVEHFAETYANYLLHKEVVKGQLHGEYSFLESEVFSDSPEREMAK